MGTAWQMARDILAAQGRCCICGEGPLATKYMCARCAKRQRETHAKVRADRRAAGLCVHCGAKPDGRKTCSHCLDVQRIWRLNRRAVQ